MKIKRDEKNDTLVPKRVVRKREADEIDDNDFETTEEIEESSSALGLNDTYNDVKNNSGELIDNSNNDNKTFMSSDLMVNETEIVENKTTNEDAPEDLMPEQKDLTDEPSIRVLPILEGSIEWSTMKNNDLDKTLYETFYELLGADSKSNFLPFASILYKKK